MALANQANHPNTYAHQQSAAYNHRYSHNAVLTVEMATAKLVNR